MLQQLPGTGLMHAVCWTLHRLTTTKSAGTRCSRHTSVKRSDTALHCAGHCSVVIPNVPRPSVLSSARRPGTIVTAAAGRAVVASGPAWRRRATTPAVPALRGVPGSRRTAPHAWRRALVRDVPVRHEPAALVRPGAAAAAAPALVRATASTAAVAAAFIGVISPASISAATLSIWVPGAGADGTSACMVPNELCQRTAAVHRSTKRVHVRSCCRTAYHFDAANEKLRKVLRIEGNQRTVLNRLRAKRKHTCRSRPPRGRHHHRRRHSRARARTHPRIRLHRHSSLLPCRNAAPQPSAHKPHLQQTWLRRIATTPA